MMKPYKIFLALLFTLAILIGIRYTNQNFNQIEKRAYAGGLALKHDFNHFYYGDEGDVVISVDVEGGRLPFENSIGFFYKPSRLAGYEGEISYTRYEMKPTVSNPNRYEIIIPRGEKGDKIFYYIELNDSDGNTVASLTSSEDDSKETWVVFAGERPLLLFLGHVLLMLAGFFFVSLAFLTSFSNLQNSLNNTVLGKQILWAVIFVLLGSAALGLNKQMFGTYWDGIPLGNDITASLALIIFLYWLIMLILMKGSAFKSSPSKNILPPGGARVLVIIGFIITTAAYLVPHGMGEF